MGMSNVSVSVGSVRVSVRVIITSASMSSTRASHAQYMHRTQAVHANDMGNAHTIHGHYMSSKCYTCNVPQCMHNT